MDFFVEPFEEDASLGWKALNIVETLIQNLIILLPLPLTLELFYSELYGGMEMFVQVYTSFHNTIVNNISPYSLLFCNIGYLVSSPVGLLRSHSIISQHLVAGSRIYLASLISKEMPDCVKE